MNEIGLIGSNTTGARNTGVPLLLLKYFIAKKDICTVSPYIGHPTVPTSCLTQTCRDESE